MLSFHLSSKWLRPLPATTVGSGGLAWLQLFHRKSHPGWWGFTQFLSFLKPIFRWHPRNWLELTMKPPMMKGFHVVNPIIKSIPEVNRLGYIGISLEMGWCDMIPNGWLMGKNTSPVSSESDEFYGTPPCSCPFRKVISEQEKYPLVI